MSRIPSNELTVFISEVAERVHFSFDSDLRYNLTWVYGGFLLGVPKRLGTNAALDAAVKALMTTHLRYSVYGGDPTPLELSQYSHALNELRLGLDDPVVACDASTLAAVMILLICQVSHAFMKAHHVLTHDQFFIGLNKSCWTGHCEGAAQMLKAKGARYNEEDEFETSLLLTLRGPVVQLANCS